MIKFSSLIRLRASFFSFSYFSSNLDIRCFSFACDDAYSPNKRANLKFKFSTVVSNFVTPNSNVSCCCCAPVCENDKVGEKLLMPKFYAATGAMNKNHLLAKTASSSKPSFRNN